MTFPGAPASSVFAFVGVPILQGSAVAPAWNRFLDDLFSNTCSRFGKKAEQVPDDDVDSLTSPPVSLEQFCQSY